MDLLQGFKNGATIPIMIVALLAMTILPLPAFVLDILFTFNIFFSLLILLVSIYTKKPLDFAVFPTILLLGTLLRLALNIASTRVVLIHGHLGPAAAGEVIHAFGNVVIGGNYAVGLVVFSILVIINFVVITKGSGRISEVSARFTLDALPGKQMAIDADLNAGLITQEDAKKRREAVNQEADFYGSMDGASKFVRGDAIAGLLILFINLIGGFFIGVIQHNLPAYQALEIYALLTIGDGLVAQLPSLLFSTAAAIMVTRESKEHDMSALVAQQLFYTKTPLLVSAIIMALLGLIPGMPHFSFLTMAGAIILWLYYLDYFDNKTTKDSSELLDKGSTSQKTQPQDSSGDPTEKEHEMSWNDVQAPEQITLEIGYQLISLAQKDHGGDLLNKLKGIRKKISSAMGFLVPSIHVKDNLNLEPASYQILFGGVIEAKFNLVFGHLLAINPGDISHKPPGLRKVKEPSFGLDAYWVLASEKEKYEILGFTVVDLSTIIATHLSQLIDKNAHLLVGHEETQKMIDQFAQKYPKLVDDTIPKKLSLSAFVKILQNLLKENVPIFDLRTILETIAEHAPLTQDHIQLTECCRQSLSKLIISKVSDDSQSALSVATLSPALEEMVQKSTKGPGSNFVLEPNLLQKLQNSLSEYVKTQEEKGQSAVLIVPPSLRAGLAALLKYAVSGLAVLSYSEIPPSKQIQIISQIG